MHNGASTPEDEPPWLCLEVTHPLNSEPPRGAPGWGAGLRDCGHPEPEGDGGGEASWEEPASSRRLLSGARRPSRAAGGGAVHPVLAAEECEVYGSSFPAHGTGGGGLSQDGVFPRVS